MATKICSFCSSEMFYSVSIDKFFCTECVYCVRSNASEKANIRFYPNDVLASKTKPLSSL